MAVSIIAYTNDFVKETLEVTCNQQIGTLTSATHYLCLYLVFTEAAHLGLDFPKVYGPNCIHMSNLI